MTNFIQPTSTTDANNNELIRSTTPQGDLIGDGSNNRVILGFQQGGFGTKDFGFKISQEGYDVLTADDSQIIMSSAFNLFKIVDTGTLSTPDVTLSAVAGTWASNSASVSTPHGITSGQAPIVIGFVYVDGVYTNMPYTVFANRLSTAPLSISYTISSDETNVTLTKWGQTYFPSNGSVTYSGGENVKFYIMQETAS